MAEFEPGEEVIVTTRDGKTFTAWVSGPLDNGNYSVRAFGVSFKIHGDQIKHGRAPLSDSERKSLLAAVENSPELAERSEEENRLLFARWLVEHGVLTDN